MSTNLQTQRAHTISESPSAPWSAPPRAWVSLWIWNCKALSRLKLDSVCNSVLVAMDFQVTSVKSLCVCAQVHNFFMSPLGTHSRRVVIFCEQHSALEPLHPGARPAHHLQTKQCRGCQIRHRHCPHRRDNAASGVPASWKTAKKMRKPWKPCTRAYEAESRLFFTFL